MKIASLDIGSNTSLLLIAEKTAKGFEALEDRIYYTRLAEGMEQKTEFSENALHRLDKAFASVREVLDKWNIDKVSIVATSASRQADNKDKLFALGQKYKLAPIEIISPEREAELTFIGAFFGLGQEVSHPLVVDIGGGSTELVSSKKSYSLNMGSVSLTEKFLNPKLLSNNIEQLALLDQYIKNHLESLGSFLEQDYEALIFVAGTPVSLAFMEKKTSDSNQIHGLLLSEMEVHFWLNKLKQLNVEQRKQIPYLPEHRADVIVSGLSLLKEILKATGKKQFVVSVTGVRYGLILEQLEKL